MKRTKRFKTIDYVVELYNLNTKEFMVYPGNAYQTMYKTRKLIEEYEEKSYKDMAIGKYKRAILRIN